MSHTKTIDGIPYVIPDDGEETWGVDLTNFFLAVADRVEAALNVISSQLALTAARLNCPFQVVTANTASTAINFALGFNIHLNLQANTTLSFSNVRDGERYVLKVVSSGPFSITWPAGVLWSDGFAPVLSGTGATDLVVLIYDGTDSTYLGSKEPNFL